MVVVWIDFVVARAVLADDAIRTAAVLSAEAAVSGKSERVLRKEAAAKTPPVPGAEAA